MQALDDKKVCRFGGEQNSVLDLFSRITAIRKNSKNENSTHSSLLESEVLFLFLILSQTTLFSQQPTSETEFRIKLFACPAFSRKSGQYCVAYGYPKSATLELHAVWAVHLHARAVKLCLELVVVVAQLDLLVAHNHCAGLHAESLDKLHHWVQLWEHL